MAMAGFALRSAPASASGTACEPNTQGVYDICVVVANGKVSGYTRWHIGDGYFNPATVYVVQCRPDLDPRYCGTIAANGGSGNNIVSTSNKAAAYGHVYHACASFSVHLDGGQINGYATNRCSKWSSWP